MLAIDAIEEALVSLGPLVHCRALPTLLTERVSEGQAGPIVDLAVSVAPRSRSPIELLRVVASSTAQAVR